MNRTLKSTAAAIAISAAAFGTLAYADQFTDMIVSDLQSNGYEYVELKVGPTQVKAEAVKGDEKIEVIYDRETGEILSQEVDRADADEIGRTGVEIKNTNEDFADEQDDDDDDDGVDEDDDEDEEDEDDDEDDDDDDDEDDDDEDDDEDEEEDDDD
ncbi:MAG: PepSY domain-containing protein [Brevirhabdus sp.]